MTTPMFTLVKTPSAYHLPTAQPVCLEVYLYLKHLQTSQHSITFNPGVEMVTVTTTVVTQSNGSNDDDNDDDDNNTSQRQTEVTETKAPINFVENKYWLNGMDTQHRFDTTMLPILHHHNAIVPTQNIIPYLKTKLYDVDGYMTPSESATIDGLRQLTHKLQSIIQYLLISLDSYPIAAGTFALVRWRVRSQYKDMVTKSAQSLGVYSQDEATLEISFILASLAARLGDATWFGSQNKISSLDFAVASCVAFCLGTQHEFLPELLYRSYPTLVNHCHNVLTQVLGSEDKLVTDVDRYTAPIRKQALGSLVGEKFSATVDQTPRKKASSRRRSAASTRNTAQNDDDDDDLDDEGDEKITSLDEGNLDGDNNSQQRANNADKLLQPSPELLYLSRHAIGLQDNPSTEPTPSQRIRQYSTQAWLGVTQWLNEKEATPTTWANQFLMLGALGLVSYFIIAQAKGQSDRDYAQALKDIESEETVTDSESVFNQRTFDFHRVDSPLVDRYQQQ